MSPPPRLNGRDGGSRAPSVARRTIGIWTLVGNYGDVQFRLPTEVIPMRLSTFHALAIGVFLAMSAGAAFADQAAQPQSVTQILRDQRELRAKLDNPSGEYSRFDEGAISRMKRAQDKVFRMFNGVTSLDQLTEDQKIDVSNSLDEVKAILLSNEGNRLICYRERKTGTNLLTKRCETYAEREAHARDSERAMRDMSRTMQTTNGG